VHRVRDDGFEISTDPARLDRGAIHAFLRETYWSPGLPREAFERSLLHSIPFGLYGPDGGQAGFARVTGDRVALAYLGDVFVFPEHRGRGLGVWLVQCVLEHPELQAVRRWYLATADAHDLYRRFGFENASDPMRHMYRERAPEELYGASGP
jgi:GNAT superfamily N-acetyltransferase